MAHVIIPDKAAKDVIRIDGICYELGGSTQQATTHTMEDIDALFDTCEECADAPSPGDVFEILACSDDSVIGYDNYSDIPVDDYFWAHNGSNYVAAYLGAEVAQAAGDRCYVDDPNGIPTQCSDVKIDFFSDDFAAASIDTCRNTAVQSTGSPVISQGSGVATIVAAAGEHGWLSSRVNQISPVFSGDFTAELDIAWSGSVPSSGYVVVLFTIRVGSTYYDIRIERTATQLLNRVFNGAYQYTNTSGVASLTAKWVKVGSTLTAYINGVSVWSTTEAGSISEAYPAQVTTIGSNVGATGTFDNFVLQDD